MNQKVEVKTSKDIKTKSGKSYNLHGMEGEVIEDLLNQNKSVVEFLVGSGKMIATFKNNHLKFL